MASDDVVSTFGGFLLEMRGPLVDSMMKESVLFGMLERDLAAARARDEAYLASLSPLERERVLVKRRIEALRRRLDNWWEENMAWRFRADPPYHDEEDW